MVCLAVAYNILNTFISKMAADTITITLYGAIAFFGLVGCAIFWSFMSWKFSVLNKIPGPIKDMTFKNWLIGVFLQVESEDFMEPQKRWWKEAGEDTKLLHYSALFGKQFVMILDADGIKKVLTSPSHEDPLYPKGFEYLARVLGHGLVTLEGQSWHRHRRIIQPAFGINFVKTALDACVPDLVLKLIGCWKANVNNDIDLSSHMGATTLDIFGKIAFSHEFEAMKSVEQWSQDPDCAVELKNPLIEGLDAALTASLTRLLLFNLKMPFMERFFLPKLHHAGVLFDQASDNVVKNAQKQSQLNNGGYKSLLEFMCSDSSHGALSQKELRHEVKTFLIAGHETTATLCTWAIYCMTKYPSIQQRLYDEVMEAHGPKDKINVDTCDKMEYMECFLKEVLRLYPPVGLTLRSASKNTTILGDKIPANTKIVVPTYLLHRHPKYWTDPLDFKPERWSKTAEKDPKFHHFAYIPFSAGSRVCIGQRFSMYEAKLILALLIREFEFIISPSLEGKELRVSSFVTIRSDPPISIRANSRCG